MGIGLTMLLAWLSVNLLPNARIATSPDFPTLGDEARDLAVGAVQIATSQGRWNDPETRSIQESTSLRSRMIQMWGLTDRETWLETFRELPSLKKKALGSVVLPGHETIASVRGYAHGQQIAVATWGVALGFATLREVSAQARKDFDSNPHGLIAYGQLFEAKRGNSGPWSQLGW
ncbi:hypothetical protein QCD70_14440 [Agreia sp. PsM10]|uniref:hypothetical protein n=1 Tax=Agreia sp. PsM10 TaxID=3030533 RepID=UPI00263AA564|nr:hypothetical protein [Agreia sp. PsM10]MDN4641450.1 hypothetical protein [Agreia sp. PsM10]